MLCKFLVFEPHGGIWASKLGFGPQSWVLGFKTGIWASRLRFGWDFSLEGRGEMDGQMEEEEGKQE